MHHESLHALVGDHEGDEEYLWRMELSRQLEQTVADRICAEPCYLPYSNAHINDELVIVDVDVGCASEIATETLSAGMASV